MKNINFLRKNQRIITAFLAFAVIAILVLLSSGINQMTFEPGRPLILFYEDEVKLPSGEAWSMPLLGSILLTMALASIPLGLLLLIFSKEARILFRRYMGMMLFLIAVYGFYLYFFRTEDEPIEPPEGLKPPSMSEEITFIDEEMEETEFYEPPELPSWQGYAVGVITILGIGIAAYLMWIKNQPPQDNLSDITLKAIKDIQSGRHWEDAVIQCYVQMSGEVKFQKKLGRNISTTPAEYAAQLKEAGLPPGPITRLTTLFEKARYSDRKSKTKEADQATQCLTDILAFLEGEI